MAPLYPEGLVSCIRSSSHKSEASQKGRKYGFLLALE